MTFKKYLLEQKLSDATVNSYVRTSNFYKRNFKTLSPKKLQEYKNYLLEKYKPRTVNQRIQAMNKYLEYRNRPDLKLKSVRLQQKPYVENVISNADYRYFKRCLKRDGRKKWYFIIAFLAATGARISELVQVKVEHIQQGVFELYGKGGKARHLYIPKKLQQEMLEWLREEERESGYVFLNRFGEVLTPRGIARQLKNYALGYGLDVNVVYPHSFRHLYAKNFLQKSEDISFLADLMGHKSIETTRIYLRKSITEQYDMVNRIVTW